ARARARVRLRETIVAADLVASALSKLSSSPPEFAVELPPAPPAGTATASVELPSGELAVFVVSEGGARPARVRIRGPSSALVAALPEILVGDRIDDVIPVITGLGLVGTEVDR